MNKRILNSFILISIIICFIFTSCSNGGKYGEVKKLLNDSIAANAKLEKAVTSANDGKAVAKAITEYLKVMKDLDPKVEALPEKYPELKSAPPEELLDLIEKYEKSIGSMYKALEKTTDYMDDPDVKKALEELEEIY